ncbi:15065_t:CDS:2 [Entrophospora sp. SA101]|nr:15325_t:CDS:2 [Entrophospora sp. SA101]CAJ0757926.1 9871_t:CDS:2 [Entrophospora sp. SA101]CAJ0759717.1 15065_t:CDS:2 [Entrophospora sp. SA101]CAJ0886050.1 16997_t:CDS:2 [Entrophospora sp. SA101]
MLSNYEALALLNEMDEKQTLQAKSEPNIKFAENLKTIQFEVTQYLTSQTPAKCQSPEKIELMLNNLKKYNLTKPEKLQIINLMPQSIAELELIIEDCEDRFKMEVLNEILVIIGSNLKENSHHPFIDNNNNSNINKPLIENDESYTFIHYEANKPES